LYWNFVVNSVIWSVADHEEDERKMRGNDGQNLYWGCEQERRGEQLKEQVHQLKCQLEENACHQWGLDKSSYKLLNKN